MMTYCVDQGNGEIGRDRSSLCLSIIELGERTGSSEKSARWNKSDTASGMTKFSAKMQDLSQSAAADRAG